MAKKLRPHGWTHILHDYNWHVCGQSDEPLKLSFQPGGQNCIHIDDYGRPVPNNERYPSAYFPDVFVADGRTGSWKHIADRIHREGLGFGLHLVVGIPKLAVQMKRPVKGTDFTADQIVAQPLCDTFIPDNWQLDLEHPGAQAYYDSIISMWAEQGIDFIYLDGVVGDKCGCRLGDAKLVADSFQRLGNGMFMYTSFGPPDAACPFEELTKIAPYVRVGADSEDSWGGSIERGFSLFTRHVAPQIRPHHFGDLGGLMVGKVHCKSHIPITGAAAKDTDCSPGPNYYIPSDRSVMSREEVISWASMFPMFRSSWWPTGVLTEMDSFYERLLTNDALIRITMMSTGNRQVMDAESRSFNGPAAIWTADDQLEAWKYVLMVNMCPCFYDDWCKAWCSKGGQNNYGPMTVAVNFVDLGLRRDVPCRVTDLWENQELPSTSVELRATLSAHGSLLVRLDCPKESSTVASAPVPDPPCPGPALASVPASTPAPNLALALQLLCPAPVPGPPGPCPAPAPIPASTAVLPQECDKHSHSSSLLGLILGFIFSIGLVFLTQMSGLIVIGIDWDVIRRRCGARVTSWLKFLSLRTATDSVKNGNPEKEQVIGHHELDKTPDRATDEEEMLAIQPA